MSGPLTRPEFIVLDAHRIAPPSSQRSLAQATGLSLGYVNQTMQRLRTSSLLAPDSSLTPAGWQALEPYRVTNAVIMAAGESTRFAPVSYERPKGLLVVKGEVLIERQIRQLREAGINDIIVVVGYRQEQFFYLEDAFGVRIVVNSEYKERNNHSSLKAAEAFLDNTYICSADNYFSENPFEPYVYQGYYSAVWCDGCTDEWGLVATPTGRIIEAVRGVSDTWIMMGHAYWDRDFSLRFKAIMNAVYHHPETPPKLWEAIYADHIADLTLQLRTYPPGVIAEFDTLDDLRAFDQDFITNIDSAILDNICATLSCRRADLSDFTPMTGGLTNMSFHFTYQGAEYVYRHPGLYTQGVLDRAAEAQAEQVAARLGLDDTFIHLDPTAGWKISHFWDVTAPFDYHNPEHVRSALTALRTLHTHPETIARRFDLFEEAKALQKRLNGPGGALASERLDFPQFKTLDSRMRQLNAYCQLDGVPTVLCHNDFYASNILISEKGQAVIDWEYAGMSDPASDLGTFIACSDYSWDDTMQVLTTYFGRIPTPEELRHHVGHVGLAAFYWWVWSLYKDALGDSIGSWGYRWYRYAMYYGTRALALYEGAGDPGAWPQDPGLETLPATLDMAPTGRPGGLRLLAPTP